MYEKKLRNSKKLNKKFNESKSKRDDETAETVTAIGQLRNKKQIEERDKERPHSGCFISIKILKFKYFNIISRTLAVFLFIFLSLPPI